MIIRRILGINYYLEPAAKEYIQKYKKAKGKKTPEIPIKMTIKEEGYSKKPTYKECLTKGVDPLDGEYIDWKIIEKFEEASPHLKKELNLLLFPIELLFIELLFIEHRVVGKSYGTFYSKM